MVKNIMIQNLKQPFAILIFFLAQEAQAQLTFTVTNVTGSSTITCSNPTINLSASSTAASVNYSWSTNSTTLSGSNVNVTQPGNYTVTASSGSLTATQMISIQVNTVFPVSSGSPSYMVSGTTAPSAYTFVAISPTVNITHYIYTPEGGTITANSSTFVYIANGTGIFWHCLLNNDNGCATCIGPSVYQPGAPGAYTNVKDHAASNSVNIWPNPTKCFFQINANTTDRFMEICTFSGSVIRQEPLSAEQTLIDISDLADGVYVIKLSGGAGPWEHFRIVKH
jgi:archaellin